MATMKERRPIATVDIITAPDGTVQIKGSWLIRSPKAIKAWLLLLRKRAEGKSALRARSVRSLAGEWMAHNLLHGLHIQRERTADVDFETDTGKAKAAAYFALAAVYRVVWRMLDKQTKSDYVQEQG